MTGTVKNVLVIAAKNGVNAVLASGILKVWISGFHFNSGNDWWNFGKTLFSVVLAREIMVWGPIVLHWSITDADPSLTAQLKNKLENAEVVSDKAIVAAEATKEAVVEAKVKVVQGEQNAPKP